MLWKADIRDARARLHRGLVDAVAACGPEYAIRGSWRWNDFHMTTRCPVVSYSDLDLVLDGCGEQDRHRRAAVVRRAVLLATGHDIRVSVQPKDHHAALTLPDSRFLVLGEYLRHGREHPAGSPKRDYLLAKSALGLLRARPEERYPQIASRLGTPYAAAAAAVKLGDRSALGAHTTQALLSTGVGIPEAALLIRLAPADTIDTQVYDDWLDDLASRQSIPPWLGSLMRSLVAAARTP